jgi:hypothetical protein
MVQSMLEFKNTFIYNILYNLLSTLFLKQTGDELILDIAWVLYKICSGDPLSLLYSSYTEILFIVFYICSL